MKIYYQWYPWAYSHQASLSVADSLKIDYDNIVWVENFKSVFNEIDNWNIWVLPIENSYAGSIHENFHNLVSGNYKIIWELKLDINHCLLWNAKNINDIKEVYSHPQALMQCENYIVKNNFSANSYQDTAGAAKFVAESWKNNIGSISSILCAKVYNLNILDENIQDQNWNTTRFFVVVKNEIFEKYGDKLKLEKVNKMSIRFKTKDTPSALYKCLWAFATRFINLSKIESLPAKQNKFEYIFWVDFQKNVSDEIIKDALKELEFFWDEMIIFWDY